MQLDLLEFRKSLTRYHEIDSLDLFYEKANEFLGRENVPSDPVLPETPEEAYVLGKMLYELEAYSDSEDWLKMAAEGGIADAQVDYGMLLYRGCGKTQSFTEALKWYEAAMEQGNLDGLCRAMAMYSNGGGFCRVGDVRCREALDNTAPEDRGKSPERFEQAKALLKRLADEGDPDARVMQESYGFTVDAGILEELAGTGNVRAMMTLANRYHFHGIPCDDPVGMAVYWTTKAAELGDADAAYSLGIAYANGFGVRYDPEKAFEYISRAAEQEIIGARVVLGKMYFHGTGVERSYQKAKEWFMTACHDEETQYHLGEIYYRGLGVERNDALAFEWYHLAMTNGYAEAKAKLAIMCANGHGTDKDPFAASSLLFDAAEEGSSLARELEGCF